GQVKELKNGCRGQQQVRKEHLVEVALVADLNEFQADNCYVPEHQRLEGKGRCMDSHNVPRHGQYNTDSGEGPKYAPKFERQVCKSYGNCELKEDCHNGEVDGV